MRVLHTAHAGWIPSCPHLLFFAFSLFFFPIGFFFSALLLPIKPFLLTFPSPLQVSSSIVATRLLALLGERARPLHPEEEQEEEEEDSPRELLLIGDLQG